MLLKNLLDVTVQVQVRGAPQRVCGAPAARGEHGAPDDHRPRKRRPAREGVEHGGH